MHAETPAAHSMSERSKKRDAMKQDASIALFAPFGQKLTETFAHVAKLNSELDRALEKERNGYNKSNPSKSSRIQVALVMLHIELKGA